MSVLSFIIPGLPMPLKRHRHGKHGGYNAPEVTAKKDEIGWIARAAMAKQKVKTIVDEPVRLQITLCWASPKPWPKRFTREASWRTSTPDRDNCEKLISDALNGIAWRDDAQVCCGPVHKVVLPSGEEPFTLVEIATPEHHEARKVAEHAMQMRDELEMGRALP